MKEERAVPRGFTLRNFEPFVLLVVTNILFQSRHIHSRNTVSKISYHGNGTDLRGQRHDYPKDDTLIASYRESTERQKNVPLCENCRNNKDDATARVADRGKEEMKKKKKERKKRNRSARVPCGGERTRVLRNRFVGTLDWTTIHEERYRGTSRSSNNRTAQHHQQPYRVNTTPTPPAFRPSRPRRDGFSFSLFRRG